MTSTGTTESDTISDAIGPARRPPFLAVVGPHVSEAASIAVTLIPGFAPLVRVPHSASPSRLRATLAAMRQSDAPLVVATDSAAAVRDADHVLVTDGGVVVEDGRPTDLLAIPGVYAQWYGDEIGANFSDPGKDVADE
ncbi:MULTISPECIES: ABC transporter ATP-binding protein/permease [Haloferax]|uniref:ABC transporter ATP-binding protein n=1 Tax=Haloferax marinum TaxID=2666143 RepID=A0A6A8G7S3_9EURY|nr:MULTISPECIES: ABC transporter ATP-binding protein/permease [Haloferax]KAB1197587.1 ABC transporter ATP-binding protein [Haloferax sp. CBA1150]MRW96638.1 hypothetical protein [Haloferax marinum]